jgi:formate--tetrahydrofolate ligase
MKNILELTKELGVPEKYVYPVGWEMGKIDLSYMDELKDRPDGHWIIVSAIEPTKLGEGKTTTAIGLQDGMRGLGLNSMLTLRQGSLGPVFGVKGNCVGNGKAGLVPINDISLHFTGDFHALTSAINLVSAVIENHIYQGNELNIDPDRIVWKRAVDMNDRSLRSVTVAQDDKKAAPHKAEYVITVAHELMSVWTVSTSKEDFKARVNKMLIAYTKDGKPVYLADLKMSNSVMLLMEHALSPNLVQTVGGNPVLISAGPFCNISCGTNSFIATKMALKLSDYVITEFGFGGSLGLEKALDVVAPMAGIKPSVAVLVATVKGLKSHGGQPFEELSIENIDALKNGVCNLECHIDTCKRQGVPFVIAINKFAQDSDNEIKWLLGWCEANGYPAAVSTAVVDGAQGAKALAETVLSTIRAAKNEYHPLYDLSESLSAKMDKICKQVYGADEVVYSDLAKSNMDLYERMGYGNSYIVVAKTPLSISDDPKLLGRPKGFKIYVKDVWLAAGAGFVIPLCGSVMMMPGLNKNCKALDEFAQLKQDAE